MALKSKTNKPKRKATGFDLTKITIVLGVLGLALTIYIGYRASISERKLFSLSLLALFAGLLFESFRITANWKNVISKFVVTYLFSLISFLPGKRESVYNFESHIAFWPYIFIFFFSLAIAIFNKDKVTAKLSEGITLLQSLSIIYWTIDYGFMNIDNWFAKTLLIIALLFSAFSIVQALTYLSLSRTVRLILSVWSTLIMFAFAVDNIYRVYHNEDIETTSYLSQGIYIGLQYFLLGVSAIYITQNYILLAGFFPNRNSNYKNDLKETKRNHIERYSENQVYIGHSILCIFYAVSLYGLNYKFEILPRHTMIWLVFLTFPLLLKLIELTNKKSSN